VAREGGSVMAGVPGGASCLAPSTIGFGEDAYQVQCVCVCVIKS
jgi:hypothetical protein